MIKQQETNYQGYRQISRIFYLENVAIFEENEMLEHLWNGNCNFRKEALSLKQWLDNVLIRSDSKLRFGMAGLPLCVL